jgi:uncharacterized membrane protein YdjX (TVP38/TMEM64 family)
VLAALAVPVPLTIVMVANGLVFGVWRGALVSLAGGLLGAAAAYTIGRALGRTVLERWMPKASLDAADRVSQRYGAWAVVLERWIPGVPGDPMSSAAGFTRMPVLPFLGWTMVGMVPGNIVTAYAGSAIPGDVPLRYWLSGIALVAAAWIGWTWWRRRRSTSAS